MKHLLTALLAFSLAACAATQPRVEQVPDLRVVTLNIYHDKAEWPKRLPLIIEQLRALDADVIALQEVLQTAELPNQAQTLGDALGYSVQFVSNDPEGQPHRYGNALLTRLPVLEQDATALEPRDDSRSMGHARLRFDGRPLDVYFTHLHHTPEGAALRRRQLEDARAFIQRHGDTAPSIVLGDFNAPVSAPELSVLDGYIDTYGALHPGADAEGVTTLNPHFFPDYRRRIDHVYARTGRFDIREARIVLDTPGVDGTWPSDHFGTFVVLRPTAR
ncbi:endonuclease/exonuclease/phosphatase family protein [Luteimonas terrae]|uniref:Endonuclease/exonuclease/phosphatase family metal-dependent hydrolase n=1 Tax=Luteimonas terrae TaxID=1530191 RepID=A0ABU1XVN4_9GAMM|nr:endonuclease/exonuclease/phosphatase family protein [Luteimonas terrae]MDR7192834.1 endonuclease/exonuclease/phosphatase family metal-dependent hydrolase [Luteimonas terrae]